MARGLVDGAYFAGCFHGGDVAHKARRILLVAEQTDHTTILPRGYYT